MNNYYVYLLINSIDQKIFYVGKGHGKRMFNHVRSALRNRKNNLKKYNKIRYIYKKHGKVVYAFFAQNLTEKQAYNLEKAKIKVLGLRNLRNLTDGGEGGGFKGKKHTVEWKLKHSISQKGKHVNVGERHPLYGKMHSLKTKKKMSVSHTGIKLSAKHKKNISIGSKGRIAWNKGISPSKETREKISLALIGRRKK